MKPWSSFIILYDSNIIAHNHHTNNYPSFYIYIYNMLTGAYLEIWPEVAKLLPHNAWEICTDRLFISVTEITPWGLRERVISKFSSNEDLFQVSLCLCLRLKGLFLYNVDI